MSIFVIKFCTTTAKLFSISSCIACLNPLTFGYFITRTTGLQFWFLDTRCVYTQRQIDKLTPSHNLPGTRSGNNNKLQKQLVYLYNAHNIHTCVNVYKCTQLKAAGHTHALMSPVSYWTSSERKQNQHNIAKCVTNQQYTK